MFTVQVSTFTVPLYPYINKHLISHIVVYLSKGKLQCLLSPFVPYYLCGNSSTSRGRYFHKSISYCYSIGNMSFGKRLYTHFEIAEPIKARRSRTTKVERESQGGMYERACRSHIIGKTKSKKEIHVHSVIHSENV